MHCTLISLPFQDPSSPQLGLALLSASLFDHGIPHTVEDANLDFLHFVEQGLWGGGPWSPFNPAQAQNAAEYLAGFRYQQSMLHQLSAAYPDYRFEPYQLSFTSGWPALSEVKRAALSPHGIWMRWLEHGGLLRRIINAAPAWVGLSVNFEGQLPAAMALGYKLKQELNTTVVWGGGFLNAFVQLLTGDTPIWDCADGVVIGAGEVMAQRMNQSGGKVIFEGATLLPGGGWIASSQQLERCRRPRFDAFPLEYYRAAGRVLPYRVFSRCHWRRCAFCGDGRFHFHENRLDGNPRLVAEELISLEAEYAAQGIYFLDAELPATFMSDLADALYAMGSNLRWGGNSRLSKRLSERSTAERLYRGGCRFLRFGLESGSDAVLRKMVKGTTVEGSERVVRAISEAGIGVHVYLMYGFPGETEADMRQTEAFLNRQTEVIDSCNVSLFELYEGSPLMSALSDADIVRNANPEYWSYPKIISTGIVDTAFGVQLEERFYAGKRRTRCFPTLADSILLAERFSLSYST